MTKISRITLLASSLLLPCALSDSFSGLTYSSSEESAQDIINTLLGDDTELEIVGGTSTTTSSSTSSSASGTVGFATVSYTDTAESGAFISGDGNGDSSTTPSTTTAAALPTTSDSGTTRNVCATSLTDAQSKSCAGNSAPCIDVRDCSLGEACFSNVLCAAAAIEGDDEGKNGTEHVNATRGDGAIISNFVLLGTSSNGQTMTSMSETALDSNSTAMDIGNYSSSTSDTTDADANGTAADSAISSQVEQAFLAIQDVIDTQIFLYETPLSEWIPSTVYRFEGFFEGLTVMHTVGVAGKKIYMGHPPHGSPGPGDADDCPHCFMYGLVNIAAFLAQAMKETIRYDACDENSWDRVGSLEMYPIRWVCASFLFRSFHSRLSSSAGATRTFFCALMRF